jgi:ATP-binding cassette subfamily B protein
MFKYIIPKKVLITMNYTLNKDSNKDSNVISTIKKLFPLLKGEQKQLILAFIFIISNSILNLISPIFIGYAVDKYIQTKQFDGIINFSIILIFLYIANFITSFLQIKIMGAVAQRTIFNLRNKIFFKIQELPIAFFNQNKVGDLISRINNDTEKLSQFFSQSLMQFIGNIFIMIGASIFILSINIYLGFYALLPAIFLFIITRLLSNFVKKKNADNLKSTGNLSAEIQESLNNFKTIVAFNRRDYFRNRFQEENEKNFKTSISSGIANSFFTPLYTFSYNIAQILVLFFGLKMISQGSFSIGFLISFLSYVTRFYDPVRQLASIWTSFQLAVASWDRISDILSLKSNLEIVENSELSNSNSILEFKNVSFSYTQSDNKVLKNISLELEKGKTYALVGPTGGGKTYALVGPTGGGKTTTAYLMMRLYDPTEGNIFFNGKDIRSYSHEERSKKIGFILQDPFLFSGTIKDNILYGNDDYQDYSEEKLLDILKSFNLEDLLNKFDKGLLTIVELNSDSISLGQKQLIAFIRAVLRKPDILILDEATANIDTVTEMLLENILNKLPEYTTKIIIAHRLNTIAEADKIFFINAGEVTIANSLDEAVNMLTHKKRES